MVEPRTAAQPAASSWFGLITLAWGTALIASSLPNILWQQLAPPVPPWLGWAQAAGLVLMIALTFVWPAAQLLRGYVLALLALTVGFQVVFGIILDSAVWKTRSQSVPVGLALLAQNVVRLIPALLSALTFIGSGLSRRDLFMVKGNLHAYAEPSRLLLNRAPTPWIRLAPRFALFFAALLILALAPVYGLDPVKFQRMLVHLPVILIAAALNAITEEFEFRSVPLARLGPVVGWSQALWILAVLFGLGHFGYAGLIGLPFFVWSGWLWGKSMLDTGGVAWAWLVHIVQDIVIYSFAVMALVR